MISIISGTNRAGSNSLKVARFLAKAYTEAGEETTLLDLQNMPAEAFSGSAYGDKPAALVEQFIEPVLASSGLHVVVPEYNGSFPGVLKYLVDLLPFPESFECRPVAFVGLAAGSNGGLRPVEQLQMVFAYRNAYLYNRRVFLPAVYKAVNEAGEIVDEDICQRLSEQAAGFARFCSVLRSSVST